MALKVVTQFPGNFYPPELITFRISINTHEAARVIDRQIPLGGVRGNNGDLQKWPRPVGGKDHRKKIQKRRLRIKTRLK